MFVFKITVFPTVFGMMRVMAVHYFTVVEITIVLFFLKSLRLRHANT